MAGLIALAAVVYGSHVADGGLYWDDWENAATTEHHPATDFLGPIDLNVLLYRPLLALALPLPHLLFGGSAAAQLALALALCALTSACLYLFLRTLGLGRLHAAPIAALALLFPWSDATRLWATGAVNNLAVSLYLLGAVAALHGLDAEGARRVRLHAASLTAFVAAILLYEIAAAAALFSVLLNVARAGWGPALRWWRLDAAVIGTTVIYTALTTTRETQSPGGIMDHAVAIAEGAVTLLGRSLAPFGPEAAPVAVGVAVAVAAAAAAALRLAPRPGALHGELRRWLAAAAIGLGAIVVGYALFVPGKASYTPLAGGTGNRVNLLAGLGFVTLTFALGMLAATLAFARMRRRATWATATALAFSVLIGAFYVGEITAHKAEWREAAALQERVLEAIHAADPPPNATVYTYGHPRYAAPGVPVFAVSWDLNSAVKARFDRNLSAYPLAFSRVPVCRERSTTPRPSFNGRRAAPSYGQVFLVDVRRGELEALPNRARCEAVAARLSATRRRSAAPAASASQG